MIYFDSAATSLHRPSTVKEAVIYAIDNFGNSGRGSHKASLEAAKAVYAARLALASLFSALPQNIVFCNNATDALNIAINGLLSPDDHIISSCLEHNSVLRPLYKLQEKGMKVDFLGIKNGNLDYDSLETFLRPNTTAVVITHASNLIGLLVDLEIIANFCKKYNLKLIVDAAQTAGSVDIDTNIGISALCFTGHKALYAPQGIGGIVLGKNIFFEGLRVGGSGTYSLDKTHPKHLPDALEAGTLNSHAISGLLAGLNWIKSQNIQNLHKITMGMTFYFIDQLQKIPKIKIYNELQFTHMPIVAFNIANIDSAIVEQILDSEYSICVRSGIHCTPLFHKALGTLAQGAVRFSFSPFNTYDEIDFSIKAIFEIAEDLA